MADLPLMRGQGWVDAGVDTATSEGIDVTANATQNTFGTWTLLATASQHSSGLWLSWGPHLGLVGSSGMTRLLNVGIDPAGGTSYQVKIPNLPASSQASVDACFLSGTFFPLEIPAGSTVAVQTSASVASSGAGEVGIQLQPSGPLFPVGPGVYTSYGADTANSRGTQHNTGGSANTKPASETQITASTSRAHRMIYLCYAVNAGAAVGSGTRGLIDISVGAGNGTVIAPNLPLFFYGAASGQATPTGGIIGPIYSDIPAGSRLAVRGQSSGTGTGGIRDMRYIILAA